MTTEFSKFVWEFKATRLPSKYIFQKDTIQKNHLFKHSPADNINVTQNKSPDFQSIFETKEIPFPPDHLVRSSRF